VSKKSKRSLKMSFWKMEKCSRMRRNFKKESILTRRKGRWIKK
jgi:hypothetical protein